MNEVSIFEGLSPAARRRLWFLQFAARSTSPEDAIALAEKMERFIDAGARAGGNGLATPQRSPDIATSSEVRNDSDHRANVCEAKHALPRGSRLLDGKQREAFVAAARSGAANSELGRLFGLSARQANALRMSFSKTGSVRPAHATKTDVDGERAAELAMQDEFLKNRPPAPLTIEDVIRFLRQRGDVVFRDGEMFVVNQSRLTPQELVERANRQRAHRHEASFPQEILWDVSPVAGRHNAKATAPAAEASGLMPAKAA